MNSESFSGENRNISIMQNPVLRQRTQCCTLCRQPGHNITTCNSDRLLDFEIICAETVRNFDNTDDFKNWLLQNYINDQLLLKAFAIRKYRVTTRCNLDQYIHYITEYIFRTYKNTPQITTPYNSSYLLTPDYALEFTNLLTTIRTRNIEREQILEQRIAEIDFVRQYIRYLSYLNSLIYRNQYQPHYQTNDLTLNIETSEEEILDETCQCSICWDDKERRQFVKLDCNHEFCKDCMKRTIETRTNLCCALCRSEMRRITLRTQEVHDEIAEIIA